MEKQSIFLRFDFFFPSPFRLHLLDDEVVAFATNFRSSIASWRVSVASPAASLASRPGRPVRLSFKLRLLDDEVVAMQRNLGRASPCRRDRFSELIVLQAFHLSTSSSTTRRIASPAASLASRPGRVATEFHEICLDVRVLDASIVATASKFWSSIALSRTSKVKSQRRGGED